MWSVLHLPAVCGKGQVLPRREPFLWYSRQQRNPCCLVVALLYLDLPSALCSFVPCGLRTLYCNTLASVGLGPIAAVFEKESFFFFLIKLTIFAKVSASRKFIPGDWVLPGIIFQNIFRLFFVFCARGSHCQLFFNVTLNTLWTVS